MIAHPQVTKIPTINTIFHIHTPSLQLWSAIKPNELSMINPICARFRNRVMFVDSIEEIVVGNFITFANVIVIRNYGVIVIGPSVEQAFDTFFYFDQMVKLHLEIMKLQNGSMTVLEMEEEEVQRLHQRHEENAYTLAKEHFTARTRAILEKDENLLDESEGR